MQDPVITGIVSFTKRNRRVITAVTAACVALGASAGALWPQPYTGREMVLVATMVADGPLEGPDLVAQRVTQRIKDAALDGTLPRSTKLDAATMVAQPPSTERSTVVELRVKAPTAADVDRAMGMAEAEIFERESKVFADEQVRLRGQIDQLRAQLERAESAPGAFDRHESVLSQIKDLKTLARQISPARAYAPSVIGRAPVEPRPLWVQVSVALALALPFGVFAGYLYAFVRLALRLARERRGARPANLASSALVG